jgi:hypothetical protein
VVGAEDTAALSEGVFTQLAGLVVLAKSVQDDCEVIGCAERVGVIGAEPIPIEPMGPPKEGNRGAWLASGLQVGGCPVEEPGHLVGCLVEPARRVDGGEHVRQQTRPQRPLHRVIPQISGQRSLQDSDNGGTRPAAVVGLTRAGTGAAQGSGDPVQVHAARSHRRQPPPTHNTGAAGQSERVPGDVAQRLGELVRVIG